MLTRMPRVSALHITRLMLVTLLVSILDMTSPKAYVGFMRHNQLHSECQKRVKNRPRWM